MSAPNVTESERRYMPYATREQWRLGLSYRYQGSNTRWAMYFRDVDDRDAFVRTFSHFITDVDRFFAQADV